MSSNYKLLNIPNGIILYFRNQVMLKLLKFVLNRVISE